MPASAYIGIVEIFFRTTEPNDGPVAAFGTRRMFMLDINNDKPAGRLR
jgi:hypothetical protein